MSRKGGQTMEHELLYRPSYSLLKIKLGQGEAVSAEAGAMVYMSGNMTFEAKAKGGVMKGLKRKLTGESFFLTEFTPAQSGGYVGFGGNAPGTIKCIELTPGKDFISDTKYAVKKLKLSTVVTVSADLPLLSGEMVDKIIESYDRCGKPALAVMVPAETRERLCLNVDYVVEMEGRCLVPAGINVLDARKINETELDEEKLVLDMKAIAVNVNTPEDLKIAERLFRLKV